MRNRLSLLFFTAAKHSCVFVQSETACHPTTSRNCDAHKQRGQSGSEQHLGRERTVQRELAYMPLHSPSHVQNLANLHHQRLIHELSLDTFPQKRHVAPTHKRKCSSSKSMSVGCFSGTGVGHCEWIIERKTEPLRPLCSGCFVAGSPPASRHFRPSIFALAAEKKKTWSPGLVGTCRNLPCRTRGFI